MARKTIDLGQVKGDKGDTGARGSSVSGTEKNTTTSTGSVDWYDVLLDDGTRISNAFSVTNGTGVVNSVNPDNLSLSEGNLDLSSEVTNKLTKLKNDGTIDEANVNYASGAKTNGELTEELSTISTELSNKGNCNFSSSGRVALFDYGEYTNERTKTIDRNGYIFGFIYGVIGSSSAILKVNGIAITTHVNLRRTAPIDISIPVSKGDVIWINNENDGSEWGAHLHLFERK